MTNINTELKEVGCELIRYAEQEAEFSAQRGVIDELFPFIFMASRRMSTRAISRWLMETRKIKLSPVTIAKALRESDKHWEECFDMIEPAALIFENVHGAPMEKFLVDHDFFFALKTNKKNLKFSGIEGYNEYQGAVDMLENNWFEWFLMLDERAREECSVFIPDDPEEHKGKVAGKHERGKRK
jgi:hypothetical protein